MPEYICNTSPLQYLHQLSQLEILPALTGGVVIPQSVAEELEAGHSAGCDAPELRNLVWITIRQPTSLPALPLAADLGRGEASVLALALEARTPVVILDDGVGRTSSGIARNPADRHLGPSAGCQEEGLDIRSIAFPGRAGSASVSRFASHTYCSAQAGRRIESVSFCWIASWSRRPVVP